MKTCSDALRKLREEAIVSEYSDLKAQLTTLNHNPNFAQSISRESFLRTAINFATDAICPVCNTPWDLTKLHEIIKSKLKDLEENAKIRARLEARLIPFISVVEEIDRTLVQMERLSKALAPQETMALTNYRTSLALNRRALRSFLPLTETISAIDSIVIVPANVTTAIATIEKAVAAIPEPTQQEVTRDFLVEHKIVLSLIKLLLVKPANQNSAPN